MLYNTILKNDNMIILRPSGTEPLIKVYITTFGEEHKRLTEFD
jgi:Phosphoglucomutase/phosphomannomutase, C-terminal domain.